LSYLARALKKANLLHENNLGKSFFADSAMGYAVQDDHLPFLSRGVPILHLISVPFPSVWHNVADDVAHLDRNVMDDLMVVFRAFAASILNLTKSL
jgi:hypothetical protein